MDSNCLSLELKKLYYYCQRRRLVQIYLALLLIGTVCFVQVVSANSSDWTVCARDRYSGINLLGPAGTDRLSLSDVRAYWTTRSCKIGGDMRVSMESYKGLGAIYIGGWYESHSVGNAQAHGHLLAFPSKGVTEEPASLLNHIRELFINAGGSKYCRSISSDHISSDTGSADIMYFEETLGVNGNGSTCYAALKIQDYLYLAVLSSRSGAPRPDSFLTIGKSTVSLGMPDGESMSSQSPKKSHNTNVPKQESDNKQNNGGTDWPELLIGGAVLYGIFMFATRKK